MREEFSQQKDEEIIKLVQSGKVEFFGVLIERYEDKMRRYSRKFLSDQEDIKDVVQEIFLKAYKNIQSFDSNPHTKFGVGAKRKFSSWLYRIAHNELVNALRKKKKNPLLLFDLDIFLPHYFQSENSLEQEFNRQQIREIIDKCLVQLEPKYREPIILYYFEDLTYQEIADVLEMPVSTVGIRIKRAKEKMKKIIKKYDK